jgi:hypothetical protein
MLTNRLYLVTKLRMSGAMPLLPLYALMEWTGSLPLLKWRASCVCHRVDTYKCFGARLSSLLRLILKYHRIIHTLIR